MDLQIGEIYAYKDLLFLLIRRDLVTSYKQTILGPLAADPTPALCVAVAAFHLLSLRILSRRCLSSSRKAASDFLFFMNFICNSLPDSFAFFFGLLEPLPSLVIYEQFNEFLRQEFFPAMSAPSDDINQNLQSMLAAINDLKATSAAQQAALSKDLQDGEAYRVGAVTCHQVATRGV